jgi:outer membrane receptor for ferrienterochelin and colicin
MKRLTLLLLFYCSLAHSQTVKLSGRSIDTAGDPIPFVNLLLSNGSGVATDLNGFYTLPMQKGKYSVEATAVGYKTIKIDGIEISEDRQLDLQFEEDRTQLAEVVVTSVAQKETQVAVVSAIKALSVVSDGISIETIKRTPDRNVADALKRVSGVTIQSDRFVLVRGLSDRYNLARFNKTQLPSTEPDRRSFSFDLIPTSLIENIIVYKSASPDLPGDFSGGIIAVSTKEVAEDQTTVSLGTGWGSVSSLRKSSLVSATEFPATFPSTYSYRVSSTAEKVAYTANLPKAEAREFTTLPNLNASLFATKSFGNLKTLFSTSIRNSYALNYTDRRDYQSSTELAYNYRDTTHTQTTTANSLLNLTYLGKDKWSWKTVHSYQATNSYVSRYGENYDNVQEVRTNSANHIRNIVLNSQIDGKLAGFSVEAGYNYIRRRQPDYAVDPLVRSLNAEEPYSLAWRDTYRFWSSLSDHTINAGISKEFIGLKLGTGVAKKIRGFNARVFRYQNELTLDEITNNTDRYSADVNSGNAFAMYTKSIKHFKFSGGLRSEYISFNMQTADFSGQQLNLENSFVNLLPSMNLSLDRGDTKWRWSASRTVSRPEFREVANFSYYDFIRNAQVVGNPNLKLANIDNVDLKFEKYISREEILFVSLFGKHFKNPIEQVVAEGSVPSNLLLTYQNPDKATLFGVEVEARKYLGDHLSLYTNGSVMKSSVNVNGVTRPMQGQSNYVVNTGVNYSRGKHSVNLSYNRVGERISAVGFQGYPDIWENSRNVVDLTLMKSIGKCEIKATLNDIIAQPSIFYQKPGRDLIKINNEQILSINLNYKL